MIEEPLSFSCPCGEVVNVNARRSWVVDDPAELAKLGVGDFNRFPCARCGAVTGVAVDLLAIHHGAAWAVQIVRDDAKLAGVAAALREMMPTYRARIVADRMEMIEKARVFAAGLDDVAIAIAKLHRWSLLAEAERKLALWFDRVCGDQLVFGVYDGFTHRGEVNVPRAAFDKIVTTFETARYQRHHIVDQTLVMKIHDLEKQKRAGTP